MKLFVYNAPAGSFLALILALAAFLAPGTSAATEIDVTRAKGEYRDSRQFFRISEFFTGRENTGNDVIRRSQPDDRAGYYLTLRLREYPYDELVEEAIRLEVILPGDIEPTLFTFPLGPEKRRNPWILVGLTGDDWPTPETLPLAWRVSFINLEGDVIAREKSFLWGDQ